MDGFNEGQIDHIANRIKNGQNVYSVGFVVSVNEFSIEVAGLDEVAYFECVVIGDNRNGMGYVDRIMSDRVFVAVTKIDGEIRIGDKVVSTGESLKTSISSKTVGMIVDPFGVDVMTGKRIEGSISIPIETDAIPLMDRTAVNRPMKTGIAAIDLMYAIGRGQRQLIIGDKKTGKTQIILDTIMNQRNQGVICFYVAIGMTMKALKRTYMKILQRGAGSYTIVVAAFNDDPAPVVKLAPYAALSMAEAFMMNGADVLVCIDDLKKHADACREIALISGKNTGREAYPADIFFAHSRLLEKGCQHKNGGSITVLPVVETKGGDITDYISTNIISITDGQIVMSGKNFQNGQKPAVDFGLSVSRLGASVQDAAIRKIGADTRRELLTFLETSDIYQFVSPDVMPVELKTQIERGRILLDKLKQPAFSPLSTDDLVTRFREPEVEEDDAKEVKTAEAVSEVQS